ncbi:MAG: hypothetical protein IKC59_08410 [Clostridia bacterium]|nr:hypothetical protein [Clostridia bacterium]MBR7099423.1 hypothetical protein [Clostridia bacterium]
MDRNKKISFSKYRVTPRTVPAGETSTVTICPMEERGRRKQIRICRSQREYFRRIRKEMGCRTGGICGTLRG